MDTLVSLGVIASSLWSWYALLFGGAGMIGMRMHMSLIPASSHATHAEIYFEGACAIVTFLLAGRLMEARTRYHSGDALRSLLELGAKDAILVEGSGSERTYRTIPAAELRVETSSRFVPETRLQPMASLKRAPVLGYFTDDG